ncbi:MAG: hypothetical protein ACR2HH_04920 [Chthoniobacterales bacterium]
MKTARRFLEVLHPGKTAGSRRATVGLTNADAARTARREQLFSLPEIPSAAERLATLLRERPDAKAETRSGKTFVLVSGLPRSGTSLMMQLPEAGGTAPGDRFHSAGRHR